MIVDIVITSYKLSWVSLAAMGLIYHIVTVMRPAASKKWEEALAVEFGMRKRCILWLEGNRMTLHNRLFHSRAYNMLASIALIATIMLTVKI